MDEQKPESAVVREVMEAKANLGKLPLAEKVLAAVSLLILIGWAMTWVQWKNFGLFATTFSTLSFLGALVVAAAVILKLFGVRILPTGLERQVISIASLLPLAGYLVNLLAVPSTFLTVAGSIALAYLSVMTYWRARVPGFATKPLSTEPPR